MRRVVLTALPLACMCGVIAGLLHLSNESTQALMVLFLVISMMIILWPELGEDSRERLRRLLRR
jgi:hypothetical protein